MINTKRVYIDMPPELYQKLKDKVSTIGTKPATYAKIIISEYFEGKQ